MTLSCPRDVRERARHAIDEAFADPVAAPLAKPFPHAIVRAELEQIHRALDKAPIDSVEF